MNNFVSEVIYVLSRHYIYSICVIMIVVYLVNPLLKDLVNPQIIVIYNHYK